MKKKLLTTVILISFSIFSFGCATNSGDLNNSSYPNHTSSYPTASESSHTGLILAGVAVAALAILGVAAASSAKHNWDGGPFAGHNFAA